MSAEDAAKVLERYKSNAGGLSLYAPTNLLIMTDTESNLQRMMRVLDELDVAR
jgi:general secretion pathway protein D